MSVHIPPNDPALEVVVLGAMLQDEGAAASTAANLMPEDFYQDRHQLVFRAAVRCLNRGIRPDLQTVGDELHRQGKLQEVGGTEYLASLVDQTPTAANVAFHARLVRDKAGKRQIIRAAMEIAEAGYRDRATLDEYRGKAEAALFGAMQAGRGSDILTPAQLAATLDKENPPLTLEADFDILDRPLPVIAEGRLVVIAGRPGIGKTALACGILVRLALANPPIPSFFLSLEQNAREIAERILAMHTGKSLYEIQTEKLPLSAVERLATSSLYVFDAGAPTLSAVLGQIRAARARYGIRLAVLDHIGKVSSARKETRNLEVGDVARGLKAIAKDLHIPVLAVCQLNRAVENRSVPRPQLSDLRESGEIEQEADAVLFLWTSDDARRRGPQLPVTFTLAKNRHGPEGEVTLTFDRPRLQFRKDGRE
jgi:replicative DNA helicase